MHLDRCIANRAVTQETLRKEVIKSKLNDRRCDLCVF